VTGDNKVLELFGLAMRDDDPAAAFTDPVGT